MSKLRKSAGMLLTRLNDVACGMARAIVCCVPRVVKVATAWGVACAPERSSPCPYACHSRPAGCARACACTLETCHVACCIRRCMYGCTLRVLLDTHRDSREHASLPSARLPASQYVRTYVRKRCVREVWRQLRLEEVGNMLVVTRVSARANDQHHCTPHDRMGARAKQRSRSHLSLSHLGRSHLGRSH